jgi:hypothetical protein
MLYAVVALPDMDDGQPAMGMDSQFFIVMYGMLHVYSEYSDKRQPVLEGKVSRGSVFGEVPFAIVLRPLRLLVALCLGDIGHCCPVWSMHLNDCSRECATLCAMHEQLSAVLGGKRGCTIRAAMACGLIRVRRSDITLLLSKKLTEISTAEEDARQRELEERRKMMKLEVCMRCRACTSRVWISRKTCSGGLTDCVP